MASNKSAYDKPFNQRNKSNDKSANANQALSGVTRFVPAKEAPSTHVPTLKLRTRMFKRECRINDNKIVFKFGTNFRLVRRHNSQRKEIKQRATNCVAYVVPGMVLSFFSNTKIEARELGQVRVF
jgi:hypothetical protein